MNDQTALEEDIDFWLSDFGTDLNDWENNFLTSIKKTLVKDPNFHPSPKQCDCLEKIRAKIEKILGNGEVEYKELSGELKFHKR